MNKRETILERIRQIEAGRIFDYDTLMSEGIRRGDVAYILYKLKKEGNIVNLTNGLYYKQKQSVLGMGGVPINSKEIISYFTTTLKQHVSGQYGYNLIGLTEQCAYTITLAGVKRFSPFTVENCHFDFMKSPIETVDNENELRIVIFLDALQNIDKVAGKSRKDVLESAGRLIDIMNKDELSLMISLAKEYPTRVRYILGSLLMKKGIKNNLKETVTNISLYDKKYQLTEPV